MGVLLVSQEKMRRYQAWEMAMTLGGPSTDDCVVRLDPLGGQSVLSFATSSGFRSRRGTGCSELRLIPGFQFGQLGRGYLLTFQIPLEEHLLGLGGY